MTPEGKVKKFIHDRMCKWFPGIWFYSPPGVGFFGKNGIPDKFYLCKGVFIAIEAKADNGHVTDLQMKRLRDIQANGGIAAIVIGKDELKMRKIRDAILRRVHLADEIRISPVQSSEGDGRVPDSE